MVEVVKNSEGYMPESWKFDDPPAYIIRGGQEVLGLSNEQVDHIENMNKILDKFYITFDVSDTGSGKTYTALAIAMLRGMSIFLVSPVNVLTTWERLAKLFGVGIFAISYESFRAGTKVSEYIVKRGGEYHTTQVLDDTVRNTPVLLVLDEVQKIKNETSVNKAIAALTSVFADNYIEGESRILAMTASLIEKESQAFSIMKAVSLYQNDIVKMINLADSLNPDKVEKLHHLYEVYVADKNKARKNKFDNNIDTIIRSDTITEPFFSTIFSEYFVPNLMSLIDVEMDTSDIDIKSVDYIVDAETLKNVRVAVNDLIDMTHKAANKAPGVKPESGIAGPMALIEHFKIPIIIEEAKRMLEANPNNKVIIYLLTYDAVNDVVEALQDFLVELGGNISQVVSIISDLKKTTTQRQPLSPFDRTIKAFQNPNTDLRVIVATNIVEGLRLHDKCGLYPRCMLMLPEYSLSTMVQKIGRIRSGDERRSKSIVRIIYIKDSGDDIIMESLARKKNTQQSFASKVNNIITDMMTNRIYVEGEFEENDFTDLDNDAYEDEEICQPDPNIKAPHRMGTGIPAKKIGQTVTAERIRQLESGGTLERPKKPTARERLMQEQQLQSQQPPTRAVLESKKKVEQTRPAEISKILIPQEKAPMKQVQLKTVEIWSEAKFNKPLVTQRELKRQEIIKEKQMMRSDKLCSERVMAILGRLSCTPLSPYKLTREEANKPLSEARRSVILGQEIPQESRGRRRSMAPQQSTMVRRARISSQPPQRQSPKYSYSQGPSPPPPPGAPIPPAREHVESRIRSPVITTPTQRGQRSSVAPRERSISPVHTASGIHHPEQTAEAEAFRRSPLTPPSRRASAEQYPERQIVERSLSRERTPSPQRSPLTPPSRRGSPVQYPEEGAPFVENPFQTSRIPARTITQAPRTPPQASRTIPQKLSRRVTVPTMRPSGAGPVQRIFQRTSAPGTAPGTVQRTFAPVQVPRKFPRASSPVQVQQTVPRPLPISRMGSGSDIGSVEEGEDTQSVGSEEEGEY